MYLLLRHFPVLCLEVTIFPLSSPYPRLGRGGCRLNQVSLTSRTTATLSCSSWGSSSDQDSCNSLRYQLVTCPCSARASWCWRLRSTPSRCASLQCSARLPSTLSVRCTSTSTPGSTWEVGANLGRCSSHQRWTCLRLFHASTATRQMCAGTWTSAFCCPTFALSRQAAASTSPPQTAPSPCHSCWLTPPRWSWRTFPYRTQGSPIRWCSACRGTRATAMSVAPVCPQCCCTQS